MKMVKKMSNISVERLPADAARMAALSQIAYLNPPRTWKEPYNLSALLNYWENDPNTRSHPKYSTAAIRILKNDPYFENMKVVGFSNDKKSGMQAFCFRTNDDVGLFAFRGTECFWKEERKDSVHWGLNDNKQKAAALNFVKETVKENKFDSMQATGHSLGGKLAEYVTVFSDHNIKKCIVFNPKNFKEKTVKNNQHLTAGKEMTRYVSYDEGKYEGGFKARVGKKEIGKDWCQDNENKNFGKQAIIAGKRHEIDDLLNNAWRNSKYLNQFGLSYDGGGINVGAIVGSVISSKTSPLILSAAATIATAAATAMKLESLNLPWRSDNNRTTTTSSFPFATKIIPDSIPFTVTISQIDDLQKRIVTLRKNYLDLKPSVNSANAIVSRVSSYYNESYVRSCCRDIEIEIKNAQRYIDIVERNLDRRRRGLIDAAEKYREADREAACDIQTATNPNRTISTIPLQQSGLPLIGAIGGVGAAIGGGVANNWALNQREQYSKIGNAGLFYKTLVGPTSGMATGISHLAKGSTALGKGVAEGMGNVFVGVSAAVGVVKVGSSVLDSIEAGDSFGRTVGVAAEKSITVGGQIVGAKYGAIGGAKVGAKVGAAFGSIIPGAGTAAGAAVGAVVGGAFGGVAGSHVGETIGNSVVEVGKAVSNAAVGGIKKAGKAIASINPFKK
jgi:hypothetical protein